MVDSKEMVKSGVWANLLHFYQPYGQKREIIDAIVEQCYRPVAESILARPRAKITINFTGVLLDLLAEYGHRDVIDMYAQAVRQGKVELVGSSKYHVILPLLPEGEALHQIEINNETNRKYFGDAFAPRGIFLPEMAFSPALIPLLERAGFEWVMCDELAFDGHVGHVDYSKTYRAEGAKLKLMFREHRLSATVMSAVTRDLAQLKAAAREELRPGRYILTALDGETFGHHRIGHNRLLDEMFADKELELARVSDVVDRFTDVEDVKPLAGTWASSERDIEQGIQFISWDDPYNAIHKQQWELLHLVVGEFDKLPHDDPIYAKLRGQLDPAVGSDQFFWAAGKPWWMIEYIERGAHDLLEVLRQIPHIDQKLMDRGWDLYHRILEMAYDWQRSGKIDSTSKVLVPFKERTLERGESGVWQAFASLMRREELAAAKRGDYELAISWRDGIYKLEHKLDIYDALHVVDLLRMKLPEGEIEDTIAHYKAKYVHLQGGQVEQRAK